MTQQDKSMLTVKHYIASFPDHVAKRRLTPMFYERFSLNPIKLS